MKRQALASLVFLVALTPAVLFVGPTARASFDTTVTVNSAADPGDGTCDSSECTLREALAVADGAPWTTVAFALPGAAPYEIFLTSPLETSADALTLDGTTQPDFAGSPVVVVAGGLTDHGLTVTGDDVTIRGIAFNRFAGGAGLTVGSTAQTTLIEGNYIGVDWTGAFASPNRWGLWVEGTSTTVRNNVISGNTWGNLVFDEGGFLNVAVGNFIGVLADGLTPAPGGGTSLYLFSGWATVGGTSTGESNVIVGSTSVGPGSPNNVFIGNLFGVGADARTVLPQSGISIEESDGNQFGPGNVVNGTLSIGSVDGSSQENVVKGNHFGVNQAGEDIGSGGVWIGGTSEASLNVIGGIAEGEGNTIVGSTGPGVSLLGSPRRNLIRGNSIHDNAGLGIDLKGDGVTPNDDGDTDSGPNDLLNYPVITSANQSAPGSVYVEGEATPDTTAVDVYSAEPDPSGFGEGAVYIGTITTQVGGSFAGVVTFSGGCLSWLTATAVDIFSNTSEFGPNFELSAGCGAVGGVAELPVATGSAQQAGAPSAGHRSPARSHAFLAVGLAAVLASAGGAWLAGRRYLRRGA